ncbi:MAG TPA: hypothetical protein VJG30_02055 [Candidatus Nanoarchaeia archaeon]|nr:hypothetical protein [Candidatus Nanoarchaeia archaeon]
MEQSNFIPYKTTIASFPNDDIFRGYKLLVPIPIEIRYYPAINLYYAHVTEAPLCNPCLGINKAKAVSYLLEYLIEKFEDPELYIKNSRSNETLLRILKKHIARIK